MPPNEAETLKRGLYISPFFLPESGIRQAKGEPG